MKRTILIIAMFAFAFTLFSCKSMSMDPKRQACKSSCAPAKDECMKKAKDDEVAKAACDAADKKCIDKCVKEANK